MKITVMETIAENMVNKMNFSIEAENFSSIRETTNIFGIKLAFQNVIL